MVNDSNHPAPLLLLSAHYGFIFECFFLLEVQNAHALIVGGIYNEAFVLQAPKANHTSCSSLPVSSLPGTFLTLLVNKSEA
jgi:hypothetical protein